jgi:hypothetical protein
MKLAPTKHNKNAEMNIDSPIGVETGPKIDKGPLLNPNTIILAPINAIGIAVIEAIQYF